MSSNLILVVVALLGVVSPVVILGLMYLKGKMNVVHWAFAATVAKSAVEWAEQYFGTLVGAEKKAKVMEYLKSKKMNIKESDWDILVEAAVSQLNKVKNVLN